MTKMKRVDFILIFFIFFISLTFAFSQSGDPVLFTVNDRPVHLSEFNYIYNKNNGDKADYSKESIEEYLNLYQNFKLKVEKARDMQLDTIPVLIAELAGYRRQLADTYLTDKEVVETLLKEVYDRQQYDVKVRHIVIRANERATMNQLMEAKETIENIKAMIDNGQKFEDMARQFSQDVNTKDQGGALNYLTAMLPNGYYEFENAMYSLEEGEVSDIVKSNVGYHLVQVIDKRPARGTMEVAHILLRKKNKSQEIQGVKPKIDSIYNLLQNGANFRTLASNLSEDINSNTKGGNIGTFGISTYEQSFEDAAFALENDGDFSKPVETSLGWHIIKRINKPQRPDFEAVKRSLQAQIKNDARYEIARQRMIENILTNAGLKENKENLEMFINSLDRDFFSYRWAPDPSLNGELFVLGGTSFSVRDFAIFCKENTKERLRFDKTMPITGAVSELYKEYLQLQALKFEELNLENKYPDFKALMREYEEGILLFEATKINVWDKASQDTTGLNAFFQNNKKNYMWKERADLVTFTINSDDPGLLDKIVKFVKRNDPEKVAQNFNEESIIVSYTSGTHELGDAQLSGIKFKEGALSELIPADKLNTTILKKIIKTYPATPKTMKDARGYIIADYQDFLDKQWINQLKKEYKITVNNEVLNNIIKS